jgi:MSHA biogenesis protein MshJ
MKDLYKRYAARLDALTERERIAITVAGAALVAFLAYALFLGPDFERRRMLQARMADQDKQIVAAQAQQQELIRALREDPDVAVRARIEEKRGQLAELDSQIAALQRALIPPERMAGVLRQLVGRGQGVQVLSLRNLPAVPIGQGGAAQPANQTGTAPVPAQLDSSTAGGVYKHGVEIVVQGSYFDLLDYVSRLEKQPWQVYWGRTVLAAEYPKVVVTLTLYTLSLDKSWLVV